MSGVTKFVEQTTGLHIPSSLSSLTNSSTPRNLHMKELIRAVRACKTAADERSVIATESATIRTSMKNKNPRYRHRNVGKLLYIHMLGYDSYFGQMECIRMLSTPNNYPEKRLGYLGLTQLLDEKTKILMLVTNSIKVDMISKDMFIQGLALAALGNIGSADMCNDLADEVAKLFTHSNTYIRKKALLTATRCIRKSPTLIETFIQPTVQVFTNNSDSKSHAVLLTCTQLLVDILKNGEYRGQFIGMVRRQCTQPTIRLLKQLIHSGGSLGSVDEYSIAGVIDPFLQIKLINLLKLLAKDHQDTSTTISDVLTQISISLEGSTSTQPSSRGVGNTILYAIADCILSIQASNDLRVLAINILGKFLASRDNNLRFTALNLLATYCVGKQRDITALQRHENTILECLNDTDYSLRQKALELMFALVLGRSNVKKITETLLVHIDDKVATQPTFTDPQVVEFRRRVTERLAAILDKYLTDDSSEAEDDDESDVGTHEQQQLYYTHTVITMLTSRATIMPETFVSDTILYIAQAPAELQTDFTYRLYHECVTAKQKNNMNSVKPELWQLTAWCIGEYGECLVSQQHLAALQKFVQTHSADDAVSKANVTKILSYAAATATDTIELLNSIAHHSNGTPRVQAYVLTALLKLTDRYPAQVPQVQQLLKKFTDSMYPEVQQRAVEYLQLTKADGKTASLRKTVAAKMPALQVVKHDSDDEEEDDEEDEEDDDAALQAKPAPRINGRAAGMSLVSKNPPTTSSPTSANRKPTPTNKASKPTPQPTSPPKPKEVNLLDLFGIDSTPTPIPAQPATSPTAASPITNGTGASQRSPSQKHSPNRAATNSVDALSDVLGSTSFGSTPSHAAATPTSAKHAASPSSARAKHQPHPPPVASEPAPSPAKPSLDDLFGEIQDAPLEPIETPKPSTPPSQPAQTATTPKSAASSTTPRTNNNPFGDSTPTHAATHEETKQATPAANDGWDADFNEDALLDNGKATTPSTVKRYPQQTVFDSPNGLLVKFDYARDTTKPEVLIVVASFSNTTGTDFQSFDFQVAVLKHVALTIEPATSTTIPAHSPGDVTQKLVLENRLHGQKKLVIRIKIDYTVDGEPKTDTAQINQFPGADE